MRLRGKAVGTLSGADIEALVENGVTESQLIEYKLALPGRSDADKKEFLADLSAFANTHGGCILYGVETKRDANGKDTGIAAGIPGLGNANLDQEKLRLEAMLQDAIFPPLRSLVRFQAIPAAEKTGPVLVIGIPSSIARPHRVTYQKTNRFWRRSESGKYEPEVTELKRMFLETSSWTEEADRFRTNRIEKVRVKRSVLAIVSSSVFIHVLPLGRMNSQIDLKPHRQKMSTVLPPPTNNGWSVRFGVDGFLTFHQPPSSYMTSYTQWFRFGGLEGYSSEYVSDPQTHGGVTYRTFDARGLSIKLENYVPEALVAMQELFDYQPPFAIGVSVHGMQGASIVVDKAHPGSPIDQDEIVAPLAILDEVDPATIRSALRPIIDSIWQSGGFPEEPRTTHR